MTINLRDAVVYDDINAAFSSVFPGLTLVFFSEPQPAGAASSITTRLASDNNLPEPIKKKTAFIALDASMPTAAAEQAFRDAGLYVQVCRKNGNDWVVTSSSDNQSLDQQNRMGLLSSEEWMEQPGEEDDRVL